MSNKFYAVTKGHNPGIYDSWDITNENVKGFSGAIYKSFNTQGEAEQFFNQNRVEGIKVQSKINTLTNEQKYVIDTLLNNNNVFLTGGGGCGKSYLISVIYEEFPALKKKTIMTGVSKFARVQLTALTGCAALLLGHKAKTLHSWAGIGLGKGTVGELFMKIRKNAKAMKNWLCTDLLIIDEISMLTGELLDKLNQLGKRIRSNQKPFGGIQLLLVGDFYQLPPVSKGDVKELFAFESVAWKECIHSTIELQQIQRQKDEVFQKILIEARKGELTKESCKILKKYLNRDWRENKIKPTLLFPRRSEVEMINDSNLRALTNKKYTFKASIVFDGKAPIDFDAKDEHFLKTLELFDAESAYAKELELAVDTQVMLIANIAPEEGLVNGSRGVITSFCNASGLPYVEFLNGAKRLIGTHTWEIEGYEFVLRSQVPLRLAYAVTIHRSQGATLDSALIDIGSGIFEYGQAYVALSRARSLDALYIYDFDPAAFKVHPLVKKFYSTLPPTIVSDTFKVDDLLLEQSQRQGQEDEKQIIAEKSVVIRSISVIKTD
jgi:ATP-dependent DNA helicase PIF1